MNELGVDNTHTVTATVLGDAGGTSLSWSDQSLATGGSIRYEVLDGAMADLSSPGLGATACAQDGLDVPAWLDTRPDPLPGEGIYYLVRAVNPCGAASVGTGRAAADALVCP